MKTKKLRTPAHHASVKKISTHWWLLTTLIAPVVSAQTANEQPIKSDVNIEEVIVTAAKRDQSLLDFSGAVSVVQTGGAHMTLSDIASRVPGFSIIDAGPRNPAGLVMRGLRVADIDANDLGSDGGVVASYVDNIPLQGYFVPPAFSLKDLQQIEVVRGPQGTLYGNASIGGLIRYITIKPDLTKSSASLTATMSQTSNSSDMNYDTDLVINAPLIESTLGVRLLLGKERNQGFIDNAYLLKGTRKDINNDELGVARLSVLWQPMDELSFAVSQHVQQIKAGDRQAANPMFTGDDYATSSRYLQPMEGELRLSSLDAGYKFSWADLTASINRYDYATQTIFDQTDLLLTYDLLYGDFYSDYEDFSAYGTSDVEVVKDSLEVRLVSPAEQRFRWLAGGFYSTDDAHLIGADIMPGFYEFLGFDRPDNIDLYFTQSEDLREHSFYAELAYDLTPAWEISIGARSFHYNDKFVSCSLFPFYEGVDGSDLTANCDNSKDEHNGTLGKFSTKYQFSDEQSVYVTIAEGFRRGGVNALPTDIETHRSYDADTSINYELGYRARLFEERFYLSAALFHIDWEDIQISGVLDNRYNITLNALAARSQGIELETVTTLNNAFSLHAGFSITEAELTEDVLNFDGVGGNVYAGDTLPGSPRYHGNLGLEYTRAINTAILEAGIHVSRISEVYTALNDEFANYDRLSGYTIANIQVSVSWRNWRAGAFINNIADTRGITGKRTGDWYGEQGQFEYVTRPRTLGVSINYTY